MIFQPSRTPPQRIPLHAAVAHQPHRRGRPCAGTSATRPAPTPEQILDLKICDPAMVPARPCRNLPPMGEHLLDAWRRTDSLPRFHRMKTNCFMLARRGAALSLCVDKNDMAGRLAKALAGLARCQGASLTFLDHALRHGDSLVGFTPARSAILTGPGIHNRSLRQTLHRTA